MLITQPDVSRDPLGGARLTVVGDVKEAPAAEVKELYLSRYENAKFWQGYGDFAYYRLEVSAAYFIAGFGVMGWISAEEYRNAQPDPLAKAAPEIIRHMNDDHSDALLLIASRFAGEAPDEAVLTAEDRLGFHLRLKSGDRIHGQRVAFLCAVRNVEDARAVFIEMVRQQKHWKHLRRSRANIFHNMPLSMTSAMPVLPNPAGASTTALAEVVISCCYGEGKRPGTLSPESRLPEPIMIELVSDPPPNELAAALRSR